MATKQDVGALVDQTLDPEDGESMEDFIDRCVDDLGDDFDEDVAREACQMKWEETAAGDDGEDEGKNEHADPGYRADAKKRYALDMPQDIRRSWYRINRQSAEYTAAQLDRIRARAASAWKARINKDGPPTDQAMIALLREAPLAAPMVIRKTRSTEGSGMEFVLSDATPDRFGDVIELAGWELDEFKANPIALFAHDSKFAIGKWEDIGIVGNALRGRLSPAPWGTSERVDEIHKLIDADILRATSVGFKPLESELINPKDPWGGDRYTRQRLMECSIVAVPANPNALAVAKSLGVRGSMLRMAFGENADRNAVSKKNVTSRGEHADKADDVKLRPPASMPKSIERRGDKPMLLSKRIQDAEKHLLALQDNLDKHLETIDDQNPNEEQMVLTEDLTAKIETGQRHLNNLKAIEAKSAATAVEPGSKAHLTASTAFRPPSGITFKEKKTEPLDYMIRAALVRCKSKAEGADIDDVRRKIYGDDEITRVACDMILKAASAPAETTVPGWAQELVRTIWAAWMEALLPHSVFPMLAAKGLALTFGANGRIVIPTRSLIPSISGSFVGEGAPIPVRQGAFSSQTLVPKKMAVITTWTREMGEYSIPAIEGLLRQAILEDTAISLDTVLLDNNAATAIRPAGLRSYQAATTASAAATGFANFVADYKALYGSLLTLTNGNVRSPVIILNPTQVLNLSMIQPPNAAAPLFPFISMVDGDKVLRAELIESSTQPPGQVIMVDAADFTTAGVEGPRMEISDQATLHMEDSTPADIVSGPTGTPVPATPVKSMWQTDSLALRLVMRMNFLMRRPVVAWTTGVAWGL